MQATGEKKECPVSRDEFRTHARPLTVTIDGQAYVADVKEFDSGSLGWNLSGKANVVINGKTCRVQMGANLTVIKSKELPK